MDDKKSDKSATDQTRLYICRFSQYIPQVKR